jgi:hypothetical protein
MHALAASGPRRSPPSADQRTGWILSAIFIALLLATLLAAGARAADAPGATEALVGRILGPTPTMSDLRELTDAVGGRVSGSPACDRGIAWAEKKFREIPADTVELEPFTMPNAWLPRRAEASCLSPAPFPLRIAAAPGTAGTPSGSSIEAPVVDAGDGSVESFARLGPKAKGARSAGVSAVLLQSSRPRGDSRAAVDGALAPVASLGPYQNPVDALDGTDDFDFLLSGIPTLVGAQDPAPYLPDYHAESDTFDRVDPRETKLAEAALAALVWNLANRDGRLAPRLTRPEIDKLIEATKLDVQMKAFAQWDDWVAGKRGHPAGGAP